MKFPIHYLRISLAAKVRLLFGAAVVIILTSALFVPWDRMTRLAEEQDLVEAHRAATLRLAQMCSGQAAPYQQGPTTGPDELERLWQRLNVKSAGHRMLEVQVLVPLTQPEGSFLARAADSFTASPDQEYVYRYRRRRVGEGRRLEIEYVRALRVNEQCAACHIGGAAKQFRANELAGAIAVRMVASRTESELFWNRFSIIGAGLVASILAVVVFYVIMKSVVLSPVRKLRRLADRIDEGELNVRSTISTGDEFEKLATAFNGMLERLQAGQQQMKRINESLNSKMEELADANVALFEANRLKNEFLASVSHELRTPLNSIIGFAEVLREQMSAQAARQDADPAAAKAVRYADNIVTSGRMLLDLINDLLDLAKIEAGKVVLRLEKVVVRELVEAVVNFMRPSADKKNLQVETRVDPDLPLVETDPGKFQQILYNLASNAVKFTPPRGHVTISARLHGADRFQVTVSDTGPGIPEEDHQAIFEKFHQADSSATREHGGTGLGLAISRELARTLGGDISLVSKVGEGATFTVTLPTRCPSDGRQQEAEDKASADALGARSGAGA